MAAEHNAITAAEKAVEKNFALPFRIIFRPLYEGFRLQIEIFGFVQSKSIIGKTLTALFQRGALKYMVIFAIITSFSQRGCGGVWAKEYNFFYRLRLSDGG